MFLFFIGWHTQTRKTFKFGIEPIFRRLGKVWVTFFFPVLESRNTYCVEKSLCKFETLFLLERTGKTSNKHLENFLPANLDNYSNKILFKPRPVLKVIFDVPWMIYGLFINKQNHVLSHKISKIAKTHAVKKCSNILGIRYK